MDAYRKYVLDKERRERKERWLGYAREAFALVSWVTLLILFLIFVAPHLP